MVCQKYKAVIVDEDDIEECLMYTHEAERRYYDIKDIGGSKGVQRVLEHRSDFQSTVSCHWFCACFLLLLKKVVLVSKDFFCLVIIVYNRVIFTGPRFWQNQSADQ